MLILSCLYGWIIKIRNRRFDKGLRSSARFFIPVICIGNLTVGGTGKTPHTEYLVRLLKDRWHLAILSRGYKRKTKGFVLADEDSTVESIGDEPLQMHRKFPDVTVAVQEKRKRGICRLLDKFPKTEVVLLDDAFQHRQVMPSLAILMMDYNRPIYKDRMMPLGNLREQADGMKRADIIIVSKCPEQLSREKQEEMLSQMKILPHQRVYFSRLRYSDLYTCQGEKVLTADELKKEARPLMSFCGIGSPIPFEKYVQGICEKAKNLRFSDHHTYSKKDVERIAQRFAGIKQQGGIILTTEKDYYHIVRNKNFSDLLPYIYYVKVNIEFLSGEEQFNQQITDHVRTYSAEQQVPKRFAQHFARRRHYTRVRLGRFGQSH